MFKIEKDGDSESMGANNFLYATNYVTEVNEYRTIEPNENVEVFPDITLDYSAEGQSKVVKGKILEWKDLHLPKGCSMFKEGILPDIPIIELPNGIFVNVGHEIKFLDSIKHASNIVPIKGLIKDSEEITKNNKDEITEKGVDDESFGSKNKVNEKNSETYQIKSEPEPDLNVNTIKKSIEHPIENSVVSTKENNPLNKNKYEKTDVNSKDDTKDVINKSKSSISKIANDDKNTTIFESPIDEYNKKEYKNYDSGEGFQISETLTERKLDSEFGKNIYLKRDDEETGKQKVNIHQLSSKKSKHSKDKSSYDIDDFSKSHHFQSNKPISPKKEIVTSFCKDNVQTENIGGLFGACETTKQNKNFQSNNKSYGKNKQNFNLNQGRPNQNNKFKNFVEKMLNKTSGRLTTGSWVGAQTSFVRQLENNNRSNTNVTFVNENGFPPGFRKFFGSQQNFIGCTSMSYVKKQNSEINKALLGANNQSQNGNFERPSGAAEISGGVRKSFVVKRGNSGRPGIGGSFIGVHIPTQRYYEGLTNDSYYLRSTMTMPSSYVSQRSPQINQGQFAINNRNFENIPNYIASTMTMPSSYVSQRSPQINQGQFAINNRHFENTPNYIASTMTMPSSYVSQRSPQINQGQFAINNRNFENIPNYIASTMTMPSSYVSQRSLQINQGQFAINNRNFKNIPNYIASTMTMPSSYVSQRSPQINQSQFVINNRNFENPPNYMASTMTMPSSYVSQRSPQINQGQFAINNRNFENIPNYIASTMTMPPSYVSHGSPQINQSQFAINNRNLKNITNYIGSTMTMPSAYVSQGSPQLNQRQFAINNQNFANTPSYIASTMTMPSSYVSQGSPQINQRQFATNNRNFENPPNYIGSTTTMPLSYVSQGCPQINQGQLGINNQSLSFALNGGYGRPSCRRGISNGVQNSFVVQNGNSGQTGILGKSVGISNKILSSYGNFDKNSSYISSMLLNQAQLRRSNYLSSPESNARYQNKISQASITEGIQSQFAGRNSSSAKSRFVGTSMTLSLLNHDFPRDLQNKSHFMRNSTKIPEINRVKEVLNISRIHTVSNNENQIFSLNGIHENYRIQGVILGAPIINGMSLEFKKQTSSHLKKIGDFSAISSSTDNLRQDICSSRNITGLEMLMQIQEIISDVSNISKFYHPPNNTAIPIKVAEMSLESIKNEYSGKYSLNSSIDEKVVKENLSQNVEDYDKSFLQEWDEIRGGKHIASNIRDRNVSDVSYEKTKDLEKKIIHNEKTGIKLKDSTVQNRKSFSKIKYKDNEKKIFSTLSNLFSPCKIGQNIFMNNFEFDKSKIISAGFKGNYNGLQVQQIEKNNETHSQHPISGIKFNQNDINTGTILAKDHPNESIKQEVHINSFKDHVNIKDISPETYKNVQKLDKYPSTGYANKPIQENIYQDPRISIHLNDQYLPALNDIKNLQKFDSFNEIQFNAKFDSSNTASGVILPNFFYDKKQQALILDKNNNDCLCLELNDNIYLPEKIPVFPPKIGYQEYYSVNNIPDGAVIGLLPVISFEKLSGVKDKETEHLKK